jgi:hypothetical protein
MNQLEKTNEETCTDDTGSGWCLRSLLHHSTGDSSARGSGSAWTHLMAGSELKDWDGVAGADGDRVHRWPGIGRNGLATPQTCKSLWHRPVKREFMCFGTRCQGVRLRSSSVGNASKRSVGIWDDQALTNHWACSCAIASSTSFALHCEKLLSNHRACPASDS